MEAVIADGTYESILAKYDLTDLRHRGCRHQPREVTRNVTTALTSEQAAGGEHRRGRP